MKVSLTPQKILILGLLAIVGVLLVGYIIYLYIVPFVTANIAYILGLGAVIALIAFARKQPKLFKKHQKNLLLIGGIALFAYFSYRAISYLALLPQETAVSLLALGFTGTIVLGASAIALTLLTIITVILLTFLNKFYLNQLHKQQDIKETYKASNLAFIFSVISAIITGIKKNFRWSLLISILLIFVINIAWITDQIGSMLQLNNLVTWSQQKIKKSYTLDDVIPPLLLNISPEELPFVINQPTINAQQAREIAYFFYKYVTNDKNYGTLIDDIKKEYPYPVNKLKSPYNAVGIFFGSISVIFGINLDPVLTDKDIDNQSKIRFLKESRNQIDLASYLLAKGFTSRQVVEINTESSAKAQNTKISPTQQRIEESAMETVLDQINKKASRSSIQQELEAFREQNAPPIYKTLGDHAITMAVIFDTTQILLNIITIISILILIGLFTYHVIIPITIAYGLPNLKQIYATLTDTRNPSTAETSVIKTALTQIEFKEKAPKYDGIRVIALSSQNAYAVGKTIVLHKGLLTLKPEEIAAVIAHEIAHIELKHTRITALMPPIPVIRRKFEYEADAWVTTKTNQGLELANFLRFHDFLDLENNTGDEPYKDTPIIGGRMHPENEMRRDRILRILGIDNQDQSFTYPDIEPQSVSNMAVANPRITPRPSKAGI